MIRLGWPPKELNPNHTGKLRAKMRAQKSYRTEAMVTALSALHGARAKPNVEIPMVITFYPPDNRRRDRDNMIASFKRGQDGIALALNADDHWFRPRYLFGEPVNGGAVVVTIGEGQ